MDNVTDLLLYREQKRRLEELSKHTAIEKLGAAELGKIVQSLTKVVLQQHELISTISTELAQSANNHDKMQEHFMYVSGQAYVALELIKQKGVATAEEVSEAWDKMVKEKILKPQGIDPEAEDLTTTEPTNEVTPE